jgi:hypothetical protein
MPGRMFTPRSNVEAFLLAFDSNLAPIVGQQVTLTRQNAAEVGPRIDLLIARAEADECDLVAKNRWGGSCMSVRGCSSLHARAYRRSPIPSCAPQRTCRKGNSRTRVCPRARAGGLALIVTGTVFSTAMTTTRGVAQHPDEPMSRVCILPVRQNHTGAPC